MNYFFKSEIHMINNYIKQIIIINVAKIDVDTLTILSIKELMKQYKVSVHDDTKYIILNLFKSLYKEKV